MNQDKAHSKFPASSSYRWLNCSGSLALIEEAPPKREGAAAKEGTEAHTVLEGYLTELQKNPCTTFGRVKTKCEKPPTKEMFDHARDAALWIQSQYQPLLGDVLLIEQKSELTWIDPDAWGTLDAAIVRVGDRLSIIDYKFGRGFVEVEGNTQLLYYALGIAKKYNFDFTEIELVVIQPRAPSDDGKINRTHTMSVDELKSFERLIANGIKRVNEKPKRFAGKWCDWCPAAIICPEYKEKANEAALVAFDGDFDPTVGVTLPHPKDLQPAAIGQILTKAKQLKKWIEVVEEYAEDLMVNRKGLIEGYKRVMKVARRQYADDNEAEKFFFEKVGFQAFDLRSPKQMEDHFPELQKEIDKRTVAISSGITIAPVDDKRPSVDDIKPAQPEERKGNNNEQEKEKGRQKSGPKKIRKPSAEEAFQEDFKEESGEVDLGF